MSSPEDGDDPFRRLRDLTADDPRVQAGVEHLQGAAREVIAATRALLDVAEDLVDDPRAARDLIGLLGPVGDVASRLARSDLVGRGGAPRSGRSRGHHDGDDADDPPVQRIPVS